MESFFDLISKILPLTFYPRWAQILFTATFLTFLASLATFVIVYPSAAARKQDAEVAISEEKLSPDALREIDNNLKDVDSLFADLGLALSAYYAAATVLRLNLLDYATANPNVESYLSNPLTSTLQRDVQDTIAKLAAIRAALAAIQRNRFTAACWNRSTYQLKIGALTRVRQSLLEHGFTDSETTIDLADLSALQQFLAIAEHRLAEFKFDSIITSVLATNSADIPAVGKAYDHAALRTFVFSGNIIFNFMTQSKIKPGVMLLASWGSAMLLDMYSCFPTPEVIRTVLLDRYPNATKAIGKLQLTVGAQQAISSDFRLAVSELDKRLSLLFLEIPDSKP